MRFPQRHADAQHQLHARSRKTAVQEPRAVLKARHQRCEATIGLCRRLHLHAHRPAALHPPTVHVRTRACSTDFGACGARRQIDYCV